MNTNGLSYSPNSPISQFVTIMASGLTTRKTRVLGAVYETERQIEAATRIASLALPITVPVSQGFCTTTYTRLFP